MRDAIAAADLPLDVQPHGLRKAAARRLAEAGCSAHEIMAMTGHKSLAEAERYTRQADQARLVRCHLEIGTRQLGKLRACPVDPVLRREIARDPRFPGLTGTPSRPPDALITSSTVITDGWIAAVATESAGGVAHRHTAAAR